jgi:hypothetical protein
LVLVLVAAAAFAGGVYAVVLSKLGPPPETAEEGGAFASGSFPSEVAGGWATAAAGAVRADRHYCLLVPLALPATVAFVYVNWLCFEFFRNG